METINKQSAAIKTIAQTSENILEKYRQEYKLDKKTRQKAEQIFNEFMVASQPNIEQVDEQTLHLTMRVAILVASKYQVHQTSDGHQVRGAALPVTMFLRGRPTILVEDFHQKLNEFIERTRLEYAVSNECLAVQNKLSVALNFYQKFTHFWNKINITDTTLNKATSEPLKKIAWIIFILAKVRILQRRGDFVEIVYLLCVILHTIVLHCPPDVSCELIEKFNKEVPVCENTSRYEQLNEYTLEFLKKEISGADHEHLLLTSKQLNDMLYTMKEKGMIKGDTEENEHMQIAYRGIDTAQQKCQQLSNKCLHGIFQNDNLKYNYRCLDQYYAKKATLDDLDERHFINSEGRLRTPLKLQSPFSRPVAQMSSMGSKMPASPMINKMIPDQQQPKGNNNNIGSGNQNNTIKPGIERQLVYTNYEEVSLSSKLNQVPFPNFVSSSPYSMKGMTPATPISQMMELRKWINDNIKRVQFDSQTQFLVCVHEFFGKDMAPAEVHGHACQIGQRIAHWTKLVMTAMAKKYATKQFQQKQEEEMHRLHGEYIVKLTLNTIEQLLRKEKAKNQKANCGSILLRELFLKSVFVNCCEIQFFATNTKELEIQDLMNLVGLYPFDLWRIMTSFMKFDPQMPKKLVNHFREVEVRIVSHLSWKHGSPVVNIIKDLSRGSGINAKNDDNNPEMNQQINQQRDNQMLMPYNLFFKRVLQLTAQTVIDLGEMLKIDQGTREIIWGVMKALLSQETDMLTDRHIDQLILCTIYGVCKVTSHPDVTFNHIIQKYTELHRRKHISWVCIEVVINNTGVQQPPQKKDIIFFYNNGYLERMREYILASRKVVQGQKASQTPVLTNSNLDLLLTPGGSSVIRPRINNLCPQTPLIQMKSSSTSTNQFGNIRGVGGSMHNPASARGSGGHLIPANLTPRTEKLYAFGETPTYKLTEAFKKEQQSSSNNNAVDPSKKAVPGTVINSFLNMVNKQNNKQQPPQPGSSNNMMLSEPPISNNQNHNTAAFRPSTGLARNLSFTGINSEQERIASTAAIKSQVPPVSLVKSSPMVSKQQNNQNQNDDQNQQ